MNNKKAAVVFISGQSNAHAHAQTLPKSERITEPLKNVFSLDREHNQSFDIDDIKWSGFTSSGKNLGESQDNTASLGYYLALNWQKAVDEGKNLPDLYIVQMSIGGQGVINGMWNPDYQKSLVPGSLDIVKISLYYLAQSVFPLVQSNLLNSGIDSEIIAWHWLGSEQDLFDTPQEVEELSKRYKKFFNDMLAMIGCDCPTYLYKIYSKKQCEVCKKDFSALDNVNNEFKELCKEHKNFRVVDPAKLSVWDESREDLGLFCSDLIHYSANTQKCFADTFFEEVLKKYK